MGLWLKDSREEEHKAQGVCAECQSSLKRKRETHSWRTIWAVWRLSEGLDSS